MQRAHHLHERERDDDEQQLRGSGRRNVRSSRSSISARRPPGSWPSRVERGRRRGTARRSRRTTAARRGSSAGWVPAMVRPRSRCAASSGSRRSCSRSGSNSAASPRRSGAWCRSGRTAAGPRAASSRPRSAAADVGEAAAEDLDRGDRAGSRAGGPGRSRRARRRPTSVSNAASTTASIRRSLSGKTRKIVPSAMPAASAIWRVVTAAPCASSSGSVAATISARALLGGSAAARVRPVAAVSGPFSGDSRRSGGLGIVAE